MKQTPDKDLYLLRNLKDAGCDDVTIQMFFQLEEAGERQEQLHLLSRQRTLLLDQTHESQHMIDSINALLKTIKIG